MNKPQEIPTKITEKIILNRIHMTTKYPQPSNLDLDTQLSTELQLEQVNIPFLFIHTTGSCFDSSMFQIRNNELSRPQSMLASVLQYSPFFTSSSWPQPMCRKFPTSIVSNAEVTCAFSSHKSASVHPSKPYKPSSKSGFTDGKSK